MSDTIIWHNPRCSKSRQTLALLQEHGVEPSIRRYLEDSPSADEIRAALAALKTTPINAMRTKEAQFSALGLSSDTEADTLINAMAQHPILIERPIVFHGNSAAIGRPPQAVLALF